MQNIRFSKEMGFTLDEFQRTLPAAVNYRRCTKTPSGFLVEIDNGSLELGVSEQKYRTIASMSLPYLDIEFSFKGLTDTAVDEIMRFFSLRFQRGGG